MIVVPKLLPHQVPLRDDDSRFKLPRCGRRFGKSRFALNAGVMGHGPLLDAGAGRRKFKGMSDGMPIAWIGPDYPQTKAIWEEEIRPRFGGLERYGVKLSESDKKVTLPNGGSLEVRSEEAIDGIRGKKFGGVILDEAAHFKNLAYAWRSVVRPTLIDLKGWAIWPSTPFIGSFFNEVVTEILAGSRGKDWTQFHYPSHANARLSREELQALIDEYPPGSTDLQQEIFGDLITEHGDVFRKEFFFGYDSADTSGMWVDGVYYPFQFVYLYVDVAASLKQTADFTAYMVAGVTAPVNGMRKAGVLHVDEARLAGPDQLEVLDTVIDLFRPTQVKMEAVAYQLTAVQHMRRKHRNIVEVYPDKDKRARAIPFAAAMARRDVFWNLRAGYMPLVFTKYISFPNEAVHDDVVDVGSMLGADISLPRKQLMVA